MKVAILKYNSGNIRSVAFALERIGINAIVTDNAEELLSADKVIFPGVGEAGSAMKFLREQKLDQVLIALKQPVLGICLGMQLLCKNSEEGTTSCLGIFDQDVKKFTGSEKVPQVGWNTINGLSSPLFKNVNENEYLYFVHSYYAEVSSYTIASTNYTMFYSSALQKNNFYGVQFHPEKSGEAGEMILTNFLNIGA
jgi:glutamine amidotransferase